MGIQAYSLKRGIAEQSSIRARYTLFQLAAKERIEDASHENRIKKKGAGVSSRILKA
jgi:hypothetical protein